MISSLVFFPLDMCILSDIYYVWLNSYFFQRYKISIFYFPVHWMHPQPEVYVLCSYNSFSNLFLTNKCKRERSQSQAKWINKQTNIFRWTCASELWNLVLYYIDGDIHELLFHNPETSQPIRSEVFELQGKGRHHDHIYFSCGKNE